MKNTLNDMRYVRFYQTELGRYFFERRDVVVGRETYGPFAPMTQRILSRDTKSF
jgi:hypothetical protein